MYREKTKNQLEFENFKLPFDGKLDKNNRWVQLAELIPWEKAEDKYKQHFSKKMGAPAKSFRIALGSLIIKERLRCTDEETVEQIKENPYLQYFIGLKAFQDKAPFEASSMVHFRTRMPIEFLQEINEMLVNPEGDTDKDNEPPKGSANGSKEQAADEAKENSDPNQGSLLLDATCNPADIRYPTDISILNEAREKTEYIIDTIFEPLIGTMKKPRTYRKRARKQYLSYIKRKQKGGKQLRKAIRQQLSYVKRNLHTISELLENGSKLKDLNKYWYKCLMVIHEVYRQQLYMYENNTRRVDDRIVSISQPHVRPIKRGKDSAKTEFGAKTLVSMLDGYTRIESCDWNNFNEGVSFIDVIEKYKERHGYYPSIVHVDKIFRNRENRKYCKEHGIKMGGKPLGRPQAGVDYEKENASIRNGIEGKFGEGKRKYGMDRIMAKLSNTGKTVIGLIVLVMNLEKKLRLLFCRFIFQFISGSKKLLQPPHFFDGLIVKNSGYCIF